MRRVFRMILLTCCASAAALSADAPEKTDTKPKVDALFAEWDRSDSPGCVLGVYRDGRIEYARGYGMANLELGVANTPQTVLDIGSTSKQFSAFAIQLLAADGKLSLDDDVRRWVPEIPSYGKTVTIRHLLHHTSGLRDYIELMSLQGLLAEDLTTDEDVLRVMALQKAPNFAPGEDHLYCNTGYFLLSVIVKRAAGKSLRDFAAERIFAPLGMRHTQFNDEHTRIIPNRATGYSRTPGTDGGWGIDMSDWEQTGDGAVLTTVEDLALWDRNFYEPKVGDVKVLAAMLETGSLNSGKKLEYASALVRGTYRGLPTVAHGGSWAGYRAQLLRFPEQRLSVACLCNNGGAANPTRLAQGVAAVYLADRMTPEAPKADAKAPEAPGVAVPDARLRSYAGAYRNAESRQIVRLSVHDGRLRAEVGGESHFLTAISPDRYRVADRRGGWQSETVFVGEGDGKRPRMLVTTTYEDGEIEKETFEPVETWTPAAADLQALAGSYASPELDTTWRLVVENGKLYVRHRGMPEEPLVPTIRDGFELEGSSLTFRRGSGGRPMGFSLDAGRVRGIRFDRQPG